MKKITLITLLLISFSAFGKKDFSKVYQKACWKKYGYNTTIAMQFCPTQDEIRKTLASK
jgi:hypothetical protein